MTTEEITAAAENAAAAESQAETLSSNEDKQNEGAASKSAKSREVIARLAQMFPNCFFTDRTKIRPLKIGILDDLVAALAGDENDLSKTQLRHAVKMYTSSWQYLGVCKAGSVRVALDGSDAGVIEEDHIQYAHDRLVASKNKFYETHPEAKKALEEKRAARQKQQQDAGKDGANKNPRRQSFNQQNRKPFADKKNSRPSAPKEKQPQVEQFDQSKLQQADLSVLSVAQRVVVSVGSRQVLATIEKIERSDVFVKLESGLALKVRGSDVFVEK